MLRVLLKSGKELEIIAAGDPDISINLGTGSRSTPLIAIEIKGGNDLSNIHNRAGEAEKSHIKAALQGYTQRWTIIRMHGVSREQIVQSTPSSTHIFDANSIITQTGGDWEMFCQHLSDLIHE